MHPNYSMSLAPGDKLRPHEVIAPIGAGRIGEVYKTRRAWAVASLSHPNVCTLLDLR
jgi:hypothetical protein